MYYNRFRYYAPEEGVYISQDPIGLAGGDKLYAYVKDVNSEVDVFGLECGKGAKGGGKYLYHYTSEAAAKNISKVGLSTEYSADGFIYLTNKANLSPLQAQIELALLANRALPTSILRIDASRLSPLILRRVQGNLPGMGAGGGTELLFNQNIPANLIKIVK